MFEATTFLFDPADWAETDSKVARLRECEAEIGRLRAEQVRLLADLDRVEVDTEEARTMADWISARLDLSPQTAHRLLTMARSRTAILAAKLGAGQWGLDRCYFLHKLAETGMGEAELGVLAEDYSLGRLYGLWERRRRVSSHESQPQFDDRYLVVQPSLDQSAHRFWGLAVGVDGEAFVRAIHQRETELPVLDDQSAGQRRVDALTSICLDSLTGSNRSEDAGRAVTVAEVFVDADLAAACAGEAGATLSSGPRVGPETLAEILCSGKVRLIAPFANAVSYSDLGEAVPTAIRALVLHRDMGQCSIEGCRSRYRLQIHHIKERARGGSQHPDNLIALCWYHHHVAIHGRGMEIDTASPVHRRRLLWPHHAHPPPDRGPPLAA